MKTLLLVQKSQRVILDNFYDAIARHCGDCDVRRLDEKEQRNLKAYFSRFVHAGDYDRIVLFLRFKRMMPQVRFIRKLPNLVLLEHDAWQNFVPGKYKGAYSRFYRQLPWARVINSGALVASRFRREGLDAHFAPKAYDADLLRDMGRNRNVELAFVGSSHHALYAPRREFLSALAEKENLLITRTSSGQDYCDMLNRIRFFASADVGFGEYMIKNFEAMACGCVLFAWNQGAVENEALGFRDMENLVLYRSLDEFRQKLALLRSDPERADRIARAGRVLVENTLTWDHAGRRVCEALVPPLRQKQVFRQWGILPRYRAAPPATD